MELQDGVDMVTSHGEANHLAIQIPVHKAGVACFINNDIEEWSTAVQEAALSAKSNWHEPPGIDELPGSVLLTWAKVDTYADVDELARVDFHFFCSTSQQGCRF